jgi:hypothetical protein
VTTLFDDFNRADGALGADWTVAQGSASIVSNDMRVATSGFVDVIAVHNTALAGIVQALKIQFNDPAPPPQYPLIVLRYTNSSSPYYLCYLDGNNGNLDFYKFPSVGGSGTLISTLTGMAAFSSGSDSLSVTITGTGSGTTIRAWRNTTASAPSDAATWDGGAAQASFTGSASADVNTGQIVGHGGTQGTADRIRITNFWAGDIGGSAGAAVKTVHLHRLMRN